MNWYKAYVSLKDHKKRFIFESRLGSKVGLHYIHLWFGYLAKFSNGGLIEDLSPVAVARYCEWEGDPNLFISSLLDAQFVHEERTGDGRIVHRAHDFAEEHSRFIEENEKRKPKGNPRVTLVKNKEEEEKKNKNSARFARFWQVWPAGRKKSRDRAEKAWLKLSEEDQEKAIAAVPLHCRQAEWVKNIREGTTHFIPLPATWLNGKCWLDELEGFRPAEKKGAELCAAFGHLLSRVYENPTDGTIPTGMKCSRCPHKEDLK